MFVFLSECTSYKTINDPTRSVSNQIESKDARCDRGILTSESWVRFTGCGGTAIPNNPPQAYHCGTISPGWIRGAHPAVAEGVVKRKLCYRFNDVNVIMALIIFQFGTVARFLFTNHQI